MTTIPTIVELFNAIKADLEAEYGSTIPLFGKNFLRTIALVQAGKLKIYYLAIGKLQKNIFVDTADPEESGGTLERFGRIKLGRNPFGATPGYYNITLIGSAGSIVPASTTFKSNDDSLSPGKLYVLDNAYTMPGTTGMITVRALESGLESRLLINDKVSSTSPIAGVNKEATVASEPTAPIAAEAIEEYRAKALDAYRLEPQGGSASDYRVWAADAQGVQKVYPYAKSGVDNEINLYVEATIANSTDGKGTPSSTLLTAVESVIELDPDTNKPMLERGRRPLGVFQVNYLPVTIRNVDIEINGFAGITPAIQTQILNAIKSETDKIRPFVSGADILSEKNNSITVNKIVSLILQAQPGSSFGTVVLKVNTVSVQTYTFLNGDIPFLNSITYP